MPTTHSFEQLLASFGTPEKIRGDDDSPPIVDVTGDNRTVRPGSLFVAIEGASFDGHRFIPDAIERGASIVVGTESEERLTTRGVCLSVPYIRVPDSRLALAWISAALHGYPSRSMEVIGITGTDGKTSTSTILESILRTATCDDRMPVGRVGVITTLGARILGQDHDTGYHVTTPDAPVVQRFLADMRDAGCSHAVIESTSHGLAQGRVMAVDFDIAAVTNITHEHMDYHGSWDAYASAKAELFRSLFNTTLKRGIPKVAVLNSDDSASYQFLLTALAEERACNGQEVRVLSYGIGRNLPTLEVSAIDSRAIDILYHPDRTTFTIEHGSGAFDVETNLIGDFNVQNILCAATVALELEIPVSAIQRGILSLTGIVGRMERIDRGQPFLALVDFAHSPASLERALLALRTVVQHRNIQAEEGQHGEDGGRIIAVFGSAGLRDKEKRALMGEVSGRLADFTVITAEDPRTEDLGEINRAIEAGLLTVADSRFCAIVPDRAQAIQFAVDMAEPGDIVVAFGKGHELSMCFGETEFPWSDQDAVSNALRTRLAL
jgi:UDP-N-acetylmuramoyl-L-alanyl-D-glutamate--2,6-diaminopimelate ligase